MTKKSIEAKKQIQKHSKDFKDVDCMRLIGLARNTFYKYKKGKAKRELLEKFDIVEAETYRNSMDKFNEHGFTSTVKYITLRRAELKA